MTYTPRPTATDLQIKYAFLTQEQPQQDPIVEPQEIARSRRVFEAVIPKIVRTDPLRILDYGGGDGRIMLPFLQRGDQCYLVDYASPTQSGVTKLGDELEAIPPDMVFDVIICSHVLEHLATPRDTLRQLRSVLTRDGIIFAEVPQEIWDGIRIEYDPVTHVNFIGRRTLEILFEYAGYEVLDSREQLGSYGRAQIEIAWLIARCSDTDLVPTRPDVSLNTYLHPGRLRSLGRIVRQYVPARAMSR